jgi:hypothetical protein
MKEKFIKYEKLSKEIKKEIESIYNLKKMDHGNIPIEGAMDEWFDIHFDKWLIKKSHNIDESRRKHFRLDIELPIRIIDTLIETSSDDSSAIDFVGNVVNISRGGLYFKYHKPIEVSSIIKVVIDLKKIDPDSKLIEALAMVIRFNKIKDDEYGIAIMFSSIYDDCRENLDSFILKNLSYHIYS